MKKRALMAFPKLTATEEMKQIAASDMPRKEKTKYGYVTEVCDYYVYLRCVVQAGILKAALFFPDYLRLDGNNPVYEVYLDILVKKDEAVVARACLRMTKGAFQKPPAVDFSFADLSQENTDSGKSAADEKAVLFLESIYTFGLNDVEKEEGMKLSGSLTTQKAAEVGVVAVLARRYLGCYERDEYVLAPFYVYISKSKNGWQYLDSLGGAAYTSAKEEYVEHPFLVMQTAMHQAEANSRNEVYYE